MITQDQVKEMLSDMESDHIERATSVNEDKLGPAVCALSNDFANRKEPGYILLGVNDNGTLAGMKWSNEELQKAAEVKTNGNVLPQPSITVSSVFKFNEGEVAVVKVNPSGYPPVRHDGRCWIKKGPGKGKATAEEEKILTLRRSASAKTYDLLPEPGSTLDDIDLEYFKSAYLPAAVDSETLAKSGETIEEQLASLRFYDTGEKCLTKAGILLFGRDPKFYLPGAYVKYIKFKGADINSPVELEKEFSGGLITEIKSIDDFIKSDIIKEHPVMEKPYQEKNIRNYSYPGLRELVLNAIIFRNYEANEPIYIYEFSNRIEISNPVGFYHDPNAQSFPYTGNYRNIVLAEAMKVLGYINRFNYGIQKAKEELMQNGNGEPVFDVAVTTKFKVSVPVNASW